jgi:TolB-like protein
MERSVPLDSQGFRWLKAAFEIQRICEKANTNLPSARPLLLRMGMQVGELIGDEREIYGGEVNLAGGLTTLAGPGEIVVSAGVRDQLTPVLDADIEDLGDCYVKPLTHPVRAYRVGPPGPRPVIEPIGAVGELQPTIAVIPFKARGGAAEHQILGEVVADHVISTLSRTTDMNVISRLSTTAFRGREANCRSRRPSACQLHRVGRLPCARRKGLAGAELAEAKSGHVVWVDDIRSDVRSIIDGKAEMIDRLVAKIGAAVTAANWKSAIQPLPTLESYTLLLGAIALMHRLSRQDFERARVLLETLIERAHAAPFPRLARQMACSTRMARLGRRCAAVDRRMAGRREARPDGTKRALDSDRIARSRSLSTDSSPPPCSSSSTSRCSATSWRSA